MNLTLTVNGEAHHLDVPANTLLVEVIRNQLGLTGTHVGCDTSQCGTCTVHVDGRAVKSCAVLAGQVDGARITTIEGIGAPGRLHPMQAAFREHHALQCGFCTPGMIMTAIEVVQRSEPLDRQAVRHALEGNLCRCTGYHHIVDAVLDAAAATRTVESRAAGEAGIREVGHG
jgi:aerobic carbon-monoxide dehydrogenase small subunit